MVMACQVIAVNLLHQSRYKSTSPSDAPCMLLLFLPSPRNL